MTIPARFKTEDAARKHLESIRWPDGPVCPHCGVIDRASRIEGGREGLLFCNACRMQFTVTVGTVFERSKIKLHVWLYATHLICSSKKGMSAHQLHRTLGVTYKTAWFMAHRIREAMETNEGVLMQSDLDHLKKGTAVLATCIVQTLNEYDLTFQERFLERLALAYREFRDNSEGDVRQELELLAWTRELLTGFNLVTGQGKPFLKS